MKRQEILRSSQNDRRAALYTQHSGLRTQHFSLYALVSLALYFLIVLLPLLWVLWSLITGLFAGNLPAIFSPRALGLLLNSLMLAGGATLVAAVIGIPLGVLIARTDLPGRWTWLFLTLLPLLLPLPLRGIAWITLCLPEGLINQFLHDLFRTTGPVLSAYGKTGCILVLGLTWFPLAVWTTVHGLLTAPVELEEDAQLDAGMCRVLASVSLRSAAASIGAGLALVFALSLAEFDIPMLLQVNVYPVEVFTYFSAYNDLAGAVRSCLPLFIVLGIFTAIALHGGRRFRFEPLSAEIRESRVFRLGVWRWPVAVLVGIVIIGPLLLDSGILLWRAGGPDAYAMAWRAAWDEAVRSVLWSFLSAGLMVSLAVCLCGFVRARRDRFPRWMALFAFAPLFIPAPVLGIALVALWNHRWSSILYDSPFMFALAYTLRFLPLAIFIISTGMAALSRELDEQATLAGAGEGSRLFRILLPGLKAPLAAAFAACFIFSFSEIGTSLLICPPGQTTLALRLDNFMHYGPDRQVAALTIGMTALLLLLAGTFILTVRHLRKDS